MYIVSHYWLEERTHTHTIGSFCIFAEARLLFTGMFVCLHVHVCVCVCVCQIAYSVVYRTPSGVHHLSVTIAIPSATPDIDNYLKCHSKPSSSRQYVTVTSRKSSSPHIVLVCCCCSWNA